MRRLVAGIFVALVLLSAPSIVRPAARIDPDVLRAIAGTYEVGGRLVYVGAAGGYADYDRGIFAILSAQDGLVLTAGRSPNDVRVTLAARPDSTTPVATFLATEQNGPPETAHRVSVFHEEDVTFDSGDVRLSGTVLVPVAKGRHAALVFIHGGMNQTRRSIGVQPYFFASRGFVVLIYDKRGCGTSTGDWRAASLADLASDALSGVSVIRNRPDVDPARVGLFGVSQGGWVADIAAARSRDVASVIAMSGPAVSPADQALYVTKRMLEREGIAPSDVAAALAFQRLTDDVVRGKRTDVELAQAVERAKQQPWFHELAPPPRDDWFWKWWPKLMDYDPRPDLRAMSQPMLAVFGAADPLVDARESDAILRGLHKATLTSRIYADAEHNLYTVSEPQFRRYPTGFFADLESWLLVGPRR